MACRLPSAHVGAWARGHAATSRLSSVRVQSLLASLPRAQQARAENVPGSFFVDHTCIDCDMCRWMAPSTFAEVNGQSAVLSQPSTDQERLQAVQALLSCPTHSIHAEKLQPGELKRAQGSLPAPVLGCPGVFYCGWATEKSYAATSYLVQRPGGNVLVDSPRYNAVLARRLEEMGGVKYMFLTHRDDVGDHQQWAKHFGCTRVLHELEVRPGTATVELRLTGEGPWRLPDGSDDVTLLFTPGHTPGHTVMLHHPTCALFTGDHLSADYDDPAMLYIFQDFNWYSVPEQVRSVQKLLEYDWLHVLPGHGRQAHLCDDLHRLQAVADLVRRHQ